MQETFENVNRVTLNESNDNFAHIHIKETTNYYRKAIRNDF